MIPFVVGDHVVCQYELVAPFIVTVREVLNDGNLMVSRGDGLFRVGNHEVRPVMPRNANDLDRYGRWWWCEGEVVLVLVMLEPPGIAKFWASSQTPHPVKEGGWAGPVAPPPKGES